MMMTSITALAGFAPNGLGVHSPHAFAHAIYWASEGYPCYVAHGDTSLVLGARAAATADFETLRSWYDAAKDADWRVRCDPSDGLLAIRFQRPRDLEYCERDLGKLPKSRVITRDGGASYYIFARPVGAPDFKFGRGINGTRAELKDSFPIPGSVHRPSGERWCYRDGCAIDCSLAFLPRQWLFGGLPKKMGAGITAVTTERPEYKPYSPLWGGH